MGTLRLTELLMEHPEMGCNRQIAVGIVDGKREHYSKEVMSQMGECKGWRMWEQSGEERKSSESVAHMATACSKA